MSLTSNSAELAGSVEVTFTVRHRLALSLATDGWSEEERTALRDGDPDAREALADSVWMNGTVEGFDDVEESFVDLRIDA